MKLFFTLIILTYSLCINAQSLDGPDGPNANYSYNGTSFEFELYNPPSSNNYMEYYMEMDYPILSARPDSFYRFQGYLIYQLTNYTDWENALMTQNNTWEEVFNDTSIFRLVAQSDKVDTNINFTNNYFDSTFMQCSALSVISNAANSGTVYNYTISTDAFTGGPFIDGNEYCFVFLSYAVNGYHNDFDCNLPSPVRLSAKSHSGAVFSLCLDPSTVGIEENLSNDISVFYNNGIHINSTLKSGCFKLISPDGKIILYKSFNENSIIDTHQISSGIYVYQIHSNNKVKTGKIYINNN